MTILTIEPTENKAASAEHNALAMQRHLSDVVTEYNQKLTTTKHPAKNQREVEMA